LATPACCVNASRGFPQREARIFQQRALFLSRWKKNASRFARRHFESFGFSSNLRILLFGTRRAGRRVVVFVRSCMFGLIGMGNPAADKVVGA